MSQLKEFSAYLKRPLEEFERIQAINFSKLFEIINSQSEPEKDYELDTIGFLSPYEFQNIEYTKQIIESKNLGYTLFLLFDIPLRASNQYLACLIPSSQVQKFSLKNTYNIAINFNKFKKRYVIHEGLSGPIMKHPIIIIDDFEMIDPAKLRLTSRIESIQAKKLRSDILFNELDDVPPPYVQTAILSSMFLAPRIESRAGIETKTFLNNAVENRTLINLDNYNQTITNLIPPEINNSHTSVCRGDFATHYVPSLRKNINIFINFPITKYKFHTQCTPNIKEDELVLSRNDSNKEIGINHQTRLNSYGSNKELIDKMMSTEFFYRQNYLPAYSINTMNKSQRLIKENQEILYSDYAQQIYKKITVPPTSISEKHKIINIAQEYCDEIKYKIKNSNDSYLNSISRSISENLMRVKTILPRSQIKIDDNLGLKYLTDLEANFDEIKQSNDYNHLPKKEVDVKKIRDIMNNSLRNIIITALKIRNYSSPVEEIIKEAVNRGYKENQIDAEINNLERAGIIFKVNNIIYLEDKYL